MKLLETVILCVCKSEGTEEHQIGTGRGVRKELLDKTYACIKMSIEISMKDNSWKGSWLQILKI